MKIVFLLQDTGSVYGAERATLDLARGLIGMGVAIHVLLIVESRLGIGRSRLQEAFAAAQIPFSTVETAARFSPKLGADIASILREEQADALHSTGYKADLHGVLATRAARIPQVSTVHGWLFRPDLKEQFYAWLNVRAFRRCARVVALSRFYENLLRERGVPRVVRIPTGFITESVLPPPPRPASPFVFGILGRLSSEKNHAMFLDAASLLLAESVSARFLIGGDGPLRDALESQIADLGLQNDIEMTGYVQPNDFFDRVSALVISSRIENQPLVVMEAMSRGIPVIATNVGGLPDLVEDNITGRLVPSGDAAALAAAMRSFCESPSVANALGQAGLGKLKHEFGPDEWISRHIALYLSL